MMGSALCWPLVDNGHTVRLVGTPLDEAIIRQVQQNGMHPKLQRSLPGSVRVYPSVEIPSALAGAEIVASGVSSFGVDWWCEAVGPYLREEVPVVAVTKGLVGQPDGSLLTLPAYTRSRLSAPVRQRVSLNAIGGPCIAHELAARRQTAVVFTGDRQADLELLRSTFSTDYYHIWISTDVVGVETCAALKNAYALAVGMAVGMMEKAGPDGLAHMYNPQAGVFAQSVLEMKRFLKLLGGDENNVDWLPGPGDLYVTVFGGRTVRLGKLLGSGMPYAEARQSMAGETLESVEIVTRVGRALPLLEQRRLIQPQDFPLMRHLYAVIYQGRQPEFEWEAFFH